jgi:hypothetical protein
MIKNTAFVAILAAAFAFGKTAVADELVLAEKGQSAYTIVVAENASPSTKHGAEELQTSLKEITGATLPIVSDKQPAGPKEIILGDNAHFRALGVQLDIPSLGSEGYVIRTVGNHLVIAGGALRGDLYGVYGFLEDHLGCRWFTPEINRIPKTERLAIKPIDERQVPALEYREPEGHECTDGQWCARNRMNSFMSRLEEKHGGKVTFGYGFFCHTFYSLVPPAEFFETHPEYFAMIKGQRQKEESQLCCTNPDVIRICTERILKAMRAQPGATIFSVSQNDGGECGCQCPACQEVVRREDSEIGPILQLVNHVAEAAEKEFPDKLVETLAYEWGRRPPKHLRPRANVLIRICSGGQCCFSHPFATCDSKPSGVFRKDLTQWAKIAPRLWAWDYIANFHNFLLPHPNLWTLGPNIRYLVANNVKGIFAEGADNTSYSEFAALRAYMLAKFLWNPNYDADIAMNEFLQAYYGKAAEPIRKYIDLLHSHVEQKNIHVLDVAPCESPHLADDVLLKADVLWQQAEAVVAGDSDVLQRVKLSRMSVDCAILERARLEKQQSLPSNQAFLTLAAARFKPFAEVLRAGPSTSLTLDGSLDKNAYLENIAKDLRLKTP